jgi:hypothetical protein
MIIVCSIQDLYHHHTKHIVLRHTPYASQLLSAIYSYQAGELQTWLNVGVKLFVSF